MRASEFITEEPRTAAPKPEIVSAHDDGKTITIKVRGHDGSVRAIANSNPAVLQQQLNLKYGLRLPHSIAKKFAGMPAAMAEDEVDEVLGFTITRDKQPKKPAPSLAAMRKEFEKDKSGSVEKTAQGRGAPAVVKYVRKTTDEDASWGMAPESQGHTQ
jgi:hypothetical protein